MYDLKEFYILRFKSEFGRKPDWKKEGDRVYIESDFVKLIMNELNETYTSLRKILAEHEWKETEEKVMETFRKEAVG